MPMLGLKYAFPDPRNLKLSAYLPATLPAIPASLPDYGATMPVAAAKWGPLGNNSVGNCVLAAQGHIIQQVTAANGCLVQPSTDATIESYSECTGYVRGDKSTDRGTGMQAGLSYWRNKGFITNVKQSSAIIDPITGGKSYTYTPYARRKCRAYIEVNSKDRDYMRAAYYLFGSLYCAAELPKYVLDGGIFGTSVWDMKPVDGGIIGGHAFSVLWINDTGPKIMTWGKPVQTTWVWWEKYVYNLGGAYAVQLAEWTNADLFTPAGFNQQQLDADLAALKRV